MVGGACCVTHVRTFMKFYKLGNHILRDEWSWHIPLKMTYDKIAM